MELETSLQNCAAARRQRTSVTGWLLRGCRAAWASERPLTEPLYGAIIAWSGRL